MTTDNATVTSSQTNNRGLELGWTMTFGSEAEPDNRARVFDPATSYFIAMETTEPESVPPLVHDERRVRGVDVTYDPFQKHYVVDSDIRALRNHTERFVNEHISVQKSISKDANYLIWLTNNAEISPLEDVVDWQLATWAVNADSVIFDRSREFERSFLDTWKTFADRVQGFQNREVFERKRLRDSLAVRLWHCFEAEPVEDGMYHPAEQVIAEALRTDYAEQAIEWLGDICRNDSEPSFAASALRCIGRDEDLGTRAWRASLIRDCLAIDDVEVRDAAVQAAESWADLELVAVLEAHSEPVSWLNDYILDVINDLAD